MTEAPKIPEQFKDCLFVRLIPDDNKPIKEATGYAEGKGLLTFEEANEYLKQEPKPNVGTVCGYKGHFEIDWDKKSKSPELDKLLEAIKSLGETYTTQTKTMEGLHFAFKLPEGEELPFMDLHDSSGLHIGELISKKKKGQSFSYCTTPGSIVEGKEYKTITEAEIRTVSKAEVLLALKSWIEEKERPEPKAFVQETESPVKISDVIDLTSFRQLSSGEYLGKHPLGCTGEGNLSINLEKNTFFDFRENYGGGSLLLYAVLKGLIKREDGNKGLKGKTFITVAITFEAEKGIKILKDQPTKKEDTEELSIDFIGGLHPKGGISEQSRTGRVFYQPLGAGEYLFISEKGKTTAFSRYNPKTSQSYIQPSFGKNPEDTFNYYFFDRPIYKLLYKFPNRNKIQSWFDGKLKPKTALEIFQARQKILKTCLDLPADHYYTILNLAIEQSWLVDFLDSMFFLKVSGGFGTAKTIVLEFFTMFAKNGMMAGDIGAPALARSIEQQGLAVAFDELDVKNSKDDDNDLLKIVRQGQRRGTPYIRCSGQNFDLKPFEVFGAKALSIHSKIERALATRTLTVNTASSNDNRLPIINFAKETLAQPVVDDKWFWYFDNVLDIQLAGLATIAELAGLAELASTEQARKEVFSQLTEKLDDNAQTLLKSLKGRSAELAYVALTVDNACRLNIVPELTESFKDKQEEDELYSENSYSEIVKDLLVKAIEEDDKTVNPSGYIQSEVLYKRFLEELDSRNWEKAGHLKFKGYLQEFGFIDRVNYKKAEIEVNDKKSSRLCCFFDERVLSALGKPSKLGKSGNDGKSGKECTTCGIVEENPIFYNYKPYCSICVRHIRKGGSA